MANWTEQIHGYEMMGLTVKFFDDEPGRVTEEHAHYQAILCGMAGSLTLFRAGMDPVELKPNTMAVIEDGQMHHAVVGETGCQYFVAFDPKQAAAYEAAQAQ